MTDTPSDAAKRKACELANAQITNQGVLYSMADAGGYDPALHAFALHLDEVDRVARRLERACSKWGWTEDGWPVLDLRSLMLPDPVDPLEEAMDIAMDCPGALSNAQIARRLRKALDERGLTIAPKEQGRLKDA